jgi:hypothetical protein
MTAPRAYATQLCVHQQQVACATKKELITFLTCIFSLGLGGYVVLLLLLAFGGRVFGLLVLVFAGLGFLERALGRNEIPKENTIR